MTFLWLNSVENAQFYHFLDVRKSQERQASKKFTTNVPKILDLKSSSEQIFFRKLSLGAPDGFGLLVPKSSISCISGVFPQHEFVVKRNQGDK